MASRPKSGTAGNRRTSARSKKPATIDLEAKEVASKETAADSAAKPTASKQAPKESPKTTQGAKPSEPSAASKTKTDDAKSTGFQKSDGKGSSSQPPKKDAPVDAKGSNGFVSALAGGLVAVLGLGAVGQFDGAKNIPLIGSLYGGGSEVANTVSPEDIAALQNKVAALTSRPTVDLAPINSKISELDGLIKSLSEASSEGDSVADAATLSRIDQLEAGIESLKNELANVVAGSGDTGLSKSDLDAALASVNTRIDAINAGVGSAEQMDGLAKELSSISDSLANLQAQVTKNSEQVTTLNSQSSELESTVASVKASEQIAKSVAVNALATALHNDDPLGLPISSLEALVGEMPETKRLAELAQAGIPTTKELVSSLDAFTEAMQNPANVSEDATLSDRFWANAQSLVTFRSTGPREGDDPSAILSRVRASLVKGELSSAASEWAALPAEAQTSGAPWKQKLDMRVEAFSLYQEISTKLAAQAG